MKRSRQWNEETSKLLAGTAFMLPLTQPRQPCSPRAPHPVLLVAVVRAVEGARVLRVAVVRAVEVGVEAEAVEVAAEAAKVVAKAVVAVHPVAAARPKHRRKLSSRVRRRCQKHRRKLSSRVRRRCPKHRRK